MHRWLSIVLVALSGLLVLACGGSGSDGPPKGTGGTGGTPLSCADLNNPPDDCDEPCASDSECAASFCENGKCVAHCTADQGCGEGSSCNARGRCVPDVGTGGTGGSGNTGGSGCQSVQVTPTRSIPNVMFLVDQSGSMRWALDRDEVPSDPSEPDRWEAAHAAITNIVSELDAIVRFGLTTYQSDDGFGPTWPDSPPFRECPIFDTQVDFAMNNFATINMSYEAQFPGGEDTPTGDSIRTLVQSIQQNPPPAEGPTIIVLATDGAPDSCEYPDPRWDSAEGVASRQEVVTEAGNAHIAGTDVFVLWVGVLSDTDISDHLQAVANAGAKDDPSIGPDADFWIGDTSNRLETAFREIVADSISCEIQMNKRFDDVNKACAEGDVRLDGAPLSCPSDWQVEGNDVIKLVGTACDTFKSGDVTFTAEFPCGAIVVE